MTFSPFLVPVPCLPPSFQTLPAALRLLCEILSPDPEGGAARVPLGQVLSLYSFLAQADGEVSREQVAAVSEFLTKEA